MIVSLVRCGGRRGRNGRHRDRPTSSGRAGARTLLVDRADTGRATDAGAGILSPETAKRDDPAWVELVLAAGRHYDALADRDWDPTRAGRAAGSCSSRPARPTCSAWEWVAERATGATEISADEARAMVPVLGKVVRALHHPRAARVDGRMMCAALRRGAERHGVRRVPARSTRCERAIPATVVVDGDAIRASGGGDRGRRVDAPAR